MTTLVKAKVSTVVDKQVPEFVRDDHQTFIKFLEAYYEFIELATDPESNLPNPGYLLRNVQSARDLDETVDKFLEYLSKELMADLPKSILSDRRLIAKHIVELYKAKGSPRSYQLLFRILFNEEIDLYYPSVDILRSSDGKFNTNTILKVTATTGNPMNLLGQTITQPLSWQKKLYVKSSEYIYYVNRLYRTLNEGYLSDYNGPEHVSGIAYNGKIRLEFISYVDENLSVNGKGAIYLSGYSTFNVTNGSKIITASNPGAFDQVNVGDTLVIVSDLTVRSTVASKSTSQIITLVDSFFGTTNAALPHNSLYLQEQPKRAKAVVESVVQTYADNILIYELTLNTFSIEGTFISDIPLYGTDYTNSENHIVMTTKPVLSNIDIVYPGSYYSPGQKFKVTGGDGFGFSCEIGSINGGGIGGVIVESGGEGYTVGDEVVINSENTGGNGAKAIVTDVERGSLGIEDGYLNYDIVPLSNIDTNTNTITIPSHGYNDNYLVQYYPVSGTGIIYGSSVYETAGNKTYRVVKVDSNNIQLKNILGEIVELDTATSTSDQVFFRISNDSINEYMLMETSQKLALDEGTVTVGPVKAVTVINKGINYKTLPILSLPDYAVLKEYSGSSSEKEGNYIVGEEITIYNGTTVATTAKVISWDSTKRILKYEPAQTIIINVNNLFVGSDAAYTAITPVYTHESIAKLRPYGEGIGSIKNVIITGIGVNYTQENVDNGLPVITPPANAIISRNYPNSYIQRQHKDLNSLGFFNSETVVVDPELFYLEDSSFGDIILLEDQTVIDSPDYIAPIGPITITGTTTQIQAGWQEVEYKASCSDNIMSSGFNRNSKVRLTNEDDPLNPIVLEATLTSKPRSTGFNLVIKYASTTIDGGGSLWSLPFTMALTDGRLINENTPTGIPGAYNSVSNVISITTDNLTGIFTEGQIIEGQSSGARAYIYTLDQGIVKPKITAIGNYNGTFINSDGMLSEYSKNMIDDYYYQDFSYVIVSNQAINSYRDAVKRLLHPVGLALFGEVTIRSTGDASMPTRKDNGDPLPNSYLKLILKQIVSAHMRILRGTPGDTIIHLPKFVQAGADLKVAASDLLPVMLLRQSDYFGRYILDMHAILRQTNDNLNQRVLVITPKYASVGGIRLEDLEKYKFFIPPYVGGVKGTAGFYKKGWYQPYHKTTNAGYWGEEGQWMYKEEDSLFLMETDEVLLLETGDRFLIETVEVLLLETDDSFLMETGKYGNTQIKDFGWITTEQILNNPKKRTYRKIFDAYIEITKV